MTIQIRISNQGHRPTNPAIVAAWVLDRQGEKCVVSDPGVVTAILAQAKEQGVKVKFYAMGKTSKKVPLDLAGVKRVLGGGKP